jgi:hypothetical protein
VHSSTTREITKLDFILIKLFTLRKTDIYQNKHTVVIRENIRLEHCNMYVIYICNWEVRLQLQDK